MEPSTTLSIFKLIASPVIKLIWTPIASRIALRGKRGRLYQELVHMYLLVGGLLQTIEMNPPLAAGDLWMENYAKYTRSEHYTYMKSRLDEFYDFPDREIIEHLYKRFLSVADQELSKREFLATIAVLEFEEAFKAGKLDRRLVKYAAQKRVYSDGKSTRTVLKPIKDAWEILELIDRGDKESIIEPTKHY